MTIITLSVCTRYFGACLNCSTMNVLKNVSPGILTGSRIGNINIIVKYFKTGEWTLSEKSQKQFKVTVNEEGKVVKKKIHSTPKVTVLDLKGSQTTMYLEEAQKLAKHKGLELISVDEIGAKPTYKFIKASEVSNYTSSESVGKSQDKGKEKSKKFVMKTSALDHDLQTKINNIIKSLDKGYSVTVEVMNLENNTSKLNEFMGKLEKEIGAKHKIFDKLFTKRILRLQYSPNLPTEKEEITEEKGS